VVWSDLGLVFASTIGTATEPRNVNRRFEQLRAAAGLDWLHLHDLRHARTSRKPTDRCSDLRSAPQRLSTLHTPCGGRLY
jgi:site-specific recombinase XerC